MLGMGRKRGEGKSSVWRKATKRSKVDVSQSGRWTQDVAKAVRESKLTMEAKVGEREASRKEEMGYFLAEGLIMKTKVELRGLDTILCWDLMFLALKGAGHWNSPRRRDCDHVSSTLPLYLELWWQEKRC